MRSGVEGGRCPHCKAEVPKDHGRSCVECGGSLQKRYLAIGCLTSKPLILVAVGLSLWLAGGDEAPAEPSGDLGLPAVEPAAVEPADAGHDPAADRPGAAGIPAPR